MPTLPGKMLDLLLPFERLDAASHQALTEFFSRFFREDLQAPVQLPQVWLWGGWLGWWMTTVAKAEGITFGRHIFLQPRLLLRFREQPPGPTGRLDALLVHEAVHVRQYTRDGLPRFLATYLSDYFRLLFRQKSLSARARFIAYWNIPYEVEARAAEAAFLKDEG